MAPTVLITGASQGTGKATALLFAQNGYDVVLTARNAERLNAVAQNVEATGQRALASPADVGDAQQVNALAEKAIAFAGSIDVLVNNAGICLTGPAEKTTLEDWNQILNTNLWGYIHTIQALLPQFLAKGSGAIVNVGSFGGKMPLPYMTAYCTSKYAITGLTDTLRLELRPKGIHVAAVHPGIINSSFMERAMFRGDDADERRSQMQDALSSAIASKPEDIAKAIWHAVNKGQTETVVGPTAIATEAYRLLPGVLQWVLQPSK
ncbi:MAG: SDR family NAD(P)-dependent oxidoreductase [Elainellaceae cyanobacterium]